MTNAEKVRFFDKIDKALNIEYPVLKEGLTKTQILALLQEKYPLLSEVAFPNLDSFKAKIWDLELDDGTTVFIGSSAYSLNKSAEDTVDDRKVINNPKGGRWLYNEGLIDLITDPDDFVEGEDLTVQDGLEAWETV